MKDRVQQNYGIDLNTSEYNAHITRTWDTMQEWVSVACPSVDLFCCSLFSVVVVVYQQQFLCIIGWWRSTVIERWYDTIR